MLSALEGDTSIVRLLVSHGAKRKRHEQLHRKLTLAVGAGRTHQFRSLAPEHRRFERLPAARTRID